MPQYRPDATEADYLRLKAAMLEFARHGQFDTNDAGRYALAHDLTNNAGDIAAILTDLVDLGELRDAGRTGGNGASRFELPE
jgi:hypothetical protein